MIRRLSSAIALLALTLLPSLAGAEVIRYVPPSGTYTGGAITSPILAPAANNCAAVPYSATGSTTSGVCFPAAGSVRLEGATKSCLSDGGYERGCFSGSDNIFYNPYQVGVLGSATYPWNRLWIGAYGAAAQLTTDAANTLGLRNGTAAQTFNIYKTWIDASNYQRGFIDQGVTTADAFTLGCIKAGSPNYCSSINLNQNGSVIAAFTNQDWSGISDQTVVGGTAPLKQLGVNRAIQGSKTKALTDAAAAASVTRIAVATNSFMGGEAIWTATSTDGTDQRTLQGKIRFAGVDKAGTVTCAAPQVIGTDLLVSTNANTLTCTWTSATSTTNCDLLATCTDNTAGSQTITMNVRLDMPLANTVTPQ